MQVFQSKRIIINILFSLSYSHQILHSVVLSALTPGFYKLDGLFSDGSPTYQQILT